MTDSQQGRTHFNKLYKKDVYHYNYKKWMFAPYVGALVKKFGVDKDALVLDIGCGTGFFTDILHGYNEMMVVGLDYSEAGIRAAQRLYDDDGIDFLVGDANALPFGNETFDLIFCRALSLYGVDDLLSRTEISEQFLQSLKKGGLFIFAWSTDGSGLRNSPRRRLIGKQDTNWINHTLTDIKQHFSSLKSSKLVGFYFINRLDLVLCGKFGLNRLFNVINRFLSNLTGIRGEAICVAKKKNGGSVMGAVRIGVIGTGVMGERHCRVCANLPRVDLMGITDLNEERGQEVAARYATTCYRDYEQLLSKLDAITIATPTDSHFELAKTCLEQGLHVMVEKPITETIEQAQQLIQMAEERGLVFQVGHIERFNPAFLELKNVTESMYLIGVTMRRLSPFDTSNTDVDVIRDLMIHDLDLVVDLTGSSIKGLGAWGRSISTTGIDHAVANLSFRDGTIATLFASRVTEQKVRAVEVIAEGAYVEADLLNKSVLVHRRMFPQYLDSRNATKYRQESIIERIHVPMFEPLMLELRHFVDCVRENRPSQVPGSDGLRALQLAETVANEIARRRT